MNFEKKKWIEIWITASKLPEILKLDKLEMYNFEQNVLKYMYI